MNQKMFGVYSRRTGWNDELTSIFVTDSDVPAKNNAVPIMAAEFPISDRFDEATQHNRAVIYCKYLNEQLIYALAAQKQVTIV